MWKFYGFSALILLQMAEMLLLHCLHTRQMKALLSDCKQTLQRRSPIRQKSNLKRTEKRK